MGKISIQELANVLIEKNEMSKRDANSFVNEMFDIIQQHLETDKLVKVKGLGTFKIIDVEDRESVNVNTGERVLIEGHGKITYAPDALLKELVNKPFSQFETVVLNDGVDFEDVPTTSTDEPEVEVDSEPIVETEPVVEPEITVRPEAAPVVEPVKVVTKPKGMKVESAEIKKLEKGHFFVVVTCNGKRHEIQKRFKSTTKAQEWISNHEYIEL